MNEADRSKTIKQEVQKHYAKAALKTIGGSGCCTGAEMANGKYAAMAGYTEEQLKVLPQGVQATSFGCGNPVSFMEVKPGQVVVDLGCGTGLDLFLAAAKTGPDGSVIGIDMTPEMIARAQANIDNSGARNIEVRQGEMEDLPIDDASVDWVISNCVINLSPDKEKVFTEIFRVLKPGGRLMVSDIVTRGEVPDEIKKDIVAWAGCLAGALPEQEYLDTARRAGLSEVKVVGRIDYTQEQMAVFSSSCCSEGQDNLNPELVKVLAGIISSVRVTAVKA